MITETHFSVWISTLIITLYHVRLWCLDIYDTRDCHSQNLTPYCFIHMLTLQNVISKKDSNKNVTFLFIHMATILQLHITRILVLHREMKISITYSHIFVDLKWKKGWKTDVIKILYFQNAVQSICLQHLQHAVEKSYRHYCIVLFSFNTLHIWSIFFRIISFTLRRAYFGKKSIRGWHPYFYSL